MKPDSNLASKLAGKDFIITAEFLPPAGTNVSAFERSPDMFNKVSAVNVADNHFGLAMSSLAASSTLLRHGIEPVLQMVTRDRNRIAIQSDLLGAAFLGITNILCLSGYHQTLMGYPQSANVYDMDSIQLVSTVKTMNEGSLLNGNRIAGNFSMLIGAAANPYLKPMDLNLLRLAKKIKAGASFIQTQAVFDIEGFHEWLEAVIKAGFIEKAAILASVLPLSSADEAKKLTDTYTDIVIPAKIIERLKSAGDQAAQKKEGLAIAVEMAKHLKNIKGLRGVHILSGGNEAVVPELISTAAL